MNSYPRFPAEHFIFEYLKEVDRYASLFRDRVARAFDGLEDEAKRIEEDEYERLNASFDPDHGDPSHGAEKAYFAGVEYYLATDAVRQGVYNLVIAGLFHLLEQQSQYLVTRVLSIPNIPPDPAGGFAQLNSFLAQKFKIVVETFKCWPQLNELRLVANTVKHGGGRSSTELKALNPGLFKDPKDPLPRDDDFPLRPLLGEGLRLTIDHLEAYKQSVEQFWRELNNQIETFFCPPRTRAGPT